MEFVIGNGWDGILAEEMNKSYFKDLVNAVETERREYTVYPPEDKTFASLGYVSYDDVRVVIVGQDPYIGEKQANGLAFAVSKEVAMPPSLKNIFREIQTDLGINMQGKSPELTGWAAQGVLLLNSSLTVRAGESNSHQALGWQNFTDFIISKIGKREKPAVFILWGAFAGKKSSLIGSNHLILKSAHPSPLSAFNGFFGSKPFSKANNFLVSKGMDPIDWGKTEFEKLPGYYRVKGSIHRA